MYYVMFALYSGSLFCMMFAKERSLSEKEDKNS